ncbi:MAG TPA: GyrI-like domain-containing protein [Ignavibacteria bacterium]|jgi:effector-binding domain-containing protein
MNVIQPYGGKAVRLNFYGPYTKLYEGWNAMMEYVKDNIKASSNPFEVYATDPEKEPDSSKWLTEIYFPIQ